MRSAYLALCLLAAATPSPAADAPLARLFDVAYYAKSATPGKMPGTSAAVIFERPHLRIAYVRMDAIKLPLVPSYSDTLVLALSDIAYEHDGKAKSIRRQGFKVWRAGIWTGDITMKAPSEMLQIVSKRERLEPAGPKKAVHDPASHFAAAIAGVAADSAGTRVKRVPGGSSLRVSAQEFAKPLTRAPSRSTDLVWYVLEGAATVTQGEAEFDAGPGVVVWLPGGPGTKPFTVTPRGGPLKVVAAELPR